VVDEAGGAAGAAIRAFEEMDTAIRATVAATTRATEVPSYVSIRKR